MDRTPELPSKHTPLTTKTLNKSNSVISARSCLYN